MIQRPRIALSSPIERNDLSDVDLRCPLTTKNVLGGTLAPCSTSPRTGFYRDGCCNTGPEDVGLHVVCAQVTADFLAFAREQGNDLITPRAGVSDFPASLRAIAGACAPRPGARRWRRVSRRR